MDCAGMKQKPPDNDIKLRPGGNSCDRVKTCLNRVMMWYWCSLCSFLVLSLGHNIHWLVNDGMRRVLEEMPQLPHYVHNI